MTALKFSRKHLGLPYALFLIVFVVFPLLLILLYAFTTETGGNTNDIVNFSFSLDNFIKFFTQSSNIRAIYISVFLSFLTTLICILIAYPLAYILANSKIKSKSTLLMLFVLPMWINFVLRTAAMRELLDVLGMYENSSLSFINTLIAMVYDYLPFSVLPIYTVLLKMDKNIIEASQDLGGNKLVTFTKVILPLSMPGIVSAVTMIFLPTMTSYVVSDTIGNGNVTIIGKLIAHMYESGSDWHGGSAISVVLLIILFISMAITNKFSSDDRDLRGGGLW